MSRPTFTPHYEEEEQAILQRVLDGLSEEWRKEPGDFIYDAVAPAPIELKNLQAKLDEVLKNGFTRFAEGQYLDYKLEEAGLDRTPAAAATGTLNVTAAEGVTIPEGHEASTVILDAGGNPITAQVSSSVTFEADGTLEVELETDDTGQQANVPAGSQWLLFPPIPGVSDITQAADFEGGLDEETDEAAYNRWVERRQRPVRSGNAQNYVTWSQEVTGVGEARVTPLWDGDGTVKVIIINTDKQPASTALVDSVQDYIDPDQDGMGEGVAPVGAVVTVESAAELVINVAATVTLASGSLLSEALAQFEADLDDYLASLVFVDGAEVVYNQIGALLVDNEHVDDYSDLTVNLGTSNVTIATNEIPTLGTTDLTDGDA